MKLCSPLEHVLQLRECSHEYSAQLSELHLHHLYVEQIPGYVLQHLYLCPLHIQDEVLQPVPPRRRQESVERDALDAEALATEAAEAVKLVELRKKW